MSTHATPDASTPFLVRSTESGAYFRNPLANVLRFIAVISFLVPIAVFLKITDVPEDMVGPMAMYGVASLVAAGLAAQVLFSRARRVLQGNVGSLFPVTPALREFARGLSESIYVWAMVNAVFGLLAFFWYAGIDDLETDAKAIAVALGAAFLGWMILLFVHLGTELATALVEIANNTHGGVRAPGEPASAPVAPVQEAAPAEPPAPPPKGRVLALVGAGVVLIGGALAFGSGASESDGRVTGAATTGAVTASVAELVEIADELRTAELRYDAEQDGWMPIRAGTMRMSALSLPGLTYSIKMDLCEVTADPEGFEVRCSVDADADGCALTVVATKDVRAHALPDTMGCR